MLTACEMKLHMVIAGDVENLSAHLGLKILPSLCDGLRREITYFDALLLKVRAKLMKGSGYRMGRIAPQC